VTSAKPLTSDHQVDLCAFPSRTTGRQTDFSIIHTLERDRLEGSGISKKCMKWHTSPSGHPEFRSFVRGELPCDYSENRCTAGTTTGKTATAELNRAVRVL
jgi:hypothetical protein